jgi:hypothetical protein
VALQILSLKLALQISGELRRKIQILRDELNAPQDFILEFDGIGGNEKLAESWSAIKVGAALNLQVRFELSGRCSSTSVLRSLQASRSV